MVKSSTRRLRVSYGQAVHDDKELRRVVRVLSEHRTIMGQETQTFEESIAKIFGRKYAIMVNSGSSANLLAMELLNLPPGSEIITPLLTFSTTIAPIVQKGLVPVFTDVEEGTYVINISQVEKLISKKTKALMIPLLLGNVPDMRKLSALAKKHKLFFVEDSCDTLGATFRGKPTATFSDITTTSFYGSHVITAGGNGGMIMVNNKKWYERTIILRGWGRRSSLLSESEDIKNRFATKLDNIPYDAKFIFGEIGYNFLPSEMGAAFGNAQLDKLGQFCRIREENLNRLMSFFQPYQHWFILPKQYPEVKTQWLAFPLTIKTNAPFSRFEIVSYLEKHNIQTRPIFTGNILKQPGFQNIPYRVIDTGCPITNVIMERGFVVGCHHGLTNIHIEKLESTFTSFLKKFK